MSFFVSKTVIDKMYNQWKYSKIGMKVRFIKKLYIAVRLLKDLTEMITLFCSMKISVYIY